MVMGFSWDRKEHLNFI